VYEYEKQWRKSVEIISCAISLVTSTQYWSSRPCPYVCGRPPFVVRVRADIFAPRNSYGESDHEDVCESVDCDEPRGIPDEDENLRDPCASLEILVLTSNIFRSSEMAIYWLRGSSRLKVVSQDHTF
jgi:hypothetical protein